MLKIKWTIEPGDGTGSSLKDAQIRNNQNICAMTNCGNKINQNSYYYLGVKICDECQKPIKALIQEYWDNFNYNIIENIELAQKCIKNTI